MANAYWILPKNITEESAVIEVRAKHIDTVIDNPNLFGLTLMNIRKTYKKYDEKIRFEGFAREEIVKSLIMKGYIHIRKNLKTDCWRITSTDFFSGLNEAEQTTLSRLADWYLVVSQEREHRHSDFEIIIIEGNGRRYGNQEFRNLVLGKVN